MTIAPILALDVDGVLVEGHPRYRWDAQIEEDLGIERNRLQNEFFYPYWRDIVLGHQPVEIQLKAFLDDHPSKVSVQEFCPTGIATMLTFEKTLLTPRSGGRNVMGVS